MAIKAFFVDTTKCTGCRACQVACKQWNNLPAEKTEFFGGIEYTNPKELSAVTYNHVKFFTIDRQMPEKPVWQIMHKKCYHCKTANCMTVCPQKAISKSNGWTIIDQNKCIGCGACEEKCIYNVPHVSKKEFMEYGTGKTIQKNKSYKCHACLLNKRDTPACVTACPTGALTIDLRIAIIKAAKKRLKDVKEDFPKASIYGMDQFGGLNVITLLKNNPRKYGLELNPKPIKLADSNIINDLYTLLSLFTLGLPSLKRVAYRIAKTITSTDNRMAS